MVKCLKQYEEVTQKFHPAEDGAKPLFLSYTHPHKLVTSQRLGHWIKNLLKEAGVDETFKVREASTSATMDRGVSLANILATADWSKESTFRRFYYRDSRTNDYGSKVLKGGGKGGTW